MPRREGSETGMPKRRGVRAEQQWDQAERKTQGVRAGKAQGSH